MSTILEEPEIYYQIIEDVENNIEGDKIICGCNYFIKLMKILKQYPKDEELSDIIIKCFRLITLLYFDKNDELKWNDNGIISPERRNNIHNTLSDVVY